MNLAIAGVSVSHGHISSCVAELETVFHGLLFGGVMFLPPIVPNKNTCQIYVFNSTIISWTGQFIPCSKYLKEHYMFCH